MDKEKLSKANELYCKIDGIKNNKRSAYATKLRNHYKSKLKKLEQELEEI